jgi:glutathione synthase/RimK-type ligase-like ATP-grasp enzyme
VFLVRSLDEIAEVFRKYRPGNLMIQEFIDSDELYKLHVIGYAAVPILAIHRPSADDRLLVDRRNKYVEAGCTGDYPALAKVAEESARCLGIEFCSVDIRLRDGSPVVLEANRRPGLIGFQEDTGYEVGIDLVKYAVARITEPSRPAE